MLSLIATIKNGLQKFRELSASKKNVVYLIAVFCLFVGTSIFIFKTHGIDAHVYYASADSLFNKGRIDMYDPNFADGQVMDYRYPPFFLFLIYPLSLLSFPWAEQLWLWINLTAVVLTVIAVKRGFKAVVGNTFRFNLILFLSFLLCAKNFFILIRYLNVHLLILCLIFGAFYFLIKRRQLIAALLMALAIGIKIMPILMFPYFALKKQWLFLSATVVLTIIFNLLPALYFGADLNSKLLGEWYQHVVVSNEFYEVNGPINLSLKGQMERYLTGIDYEKRDHDPNYQNVNIASLSPEQVEWIWRIINLFVAVGTIFLIWYCARIRNKDELFNSKFDSSSFPEFGLMSCLILLIMPRSTNIYFVALFFSLIPFFYNLFRRKSKFNIAAFALMIILTVVLPLVPGRAAQRYFQVLGIDFYLAVVVWISLIYNLISGSLAKRNDFSERSEIELK